LEWGFEFYIIGGVGRGFLGDKGMGRGIDFEV
jgi:hypothetical protein